MKIWTTLLLVTTFVSLFGQTSKELEYLKARDNYINYFKSLSDSTLYLTKTYKQDSASLLVLEKMLREIMQGSHLDSISKFGKINLETLMPDLGSGMLDGLTLNKNNFNSLQEFVTTKGLFFDYFKEKQIKSIDNLTPSQLSNIFTSLFSDAQAIVFFSTKISSPKNNQVYGTIGTVGQDIGLSPDYIFVLISQGDYIFIIEKSLANPFTVLHKCQVVYDSIYSESLKQFEKYRASNLKDTTAINNTFALEQTAWDKYCECCQNNFKADKQFDAMQKEIINIVKYTEKQNNR